MLEDKSNSVKKAMSLQIGAVISAGEAPVPEELISYFNSMSISTGVKN